MGKGCKKFSDDKQFRILRVMYYNKASDTMSSLLMAMMVILMILYYMNGAGVGAGAAWFTVRRQALHPTKKLQHMWG